MLVFSKLLHFNKLKINPKLWVDLIAKYII